MKLGIKHLAPYLPYELKVNLTRRLFERENVDLMGSMIAYNGTTKEHWIMESNVTYGLFDVKPILRPLSYLTKEIEHNGEKFVPIEWFEEKYYTLDLHKQCLRLLEEDGENWINQSDYMLVQHLIEWHFDIFGLIENKLAIDINTITK